MGIITVETLGPFRLIESGRPLRIPRAKEKALIGFLAANTSRQFQREYLANLLWGKSSEPAAKHSLNNALYTIKRVAPSLLTVNSTFVCINATTVTTDLQVLAGFMESHKLLPNLAIIKGEFLADIELRDISEFESWRSDFNRTLFFNIDAVATEEFAKLEIAERSVISLKLASLAAICPCLDIARLSQIPPLSPAGNASGPEVLGAPTTFLLPLVGRDRQLSDLHRYWKSSRDRTAQFVNVVGHPGHGKTRLVEEFIRSIRTDEVRVLKARCYQSERRIAFGPIVEMFVDGLRPSDLAAIEPIWLAALQELIPTLPVNRAVAPQLSRAASLSRLYEAVVQVIETIAERSPLLIFLDDVQWSDKSTQAILSILTHRLHAPVMLVVAERHDSLSRNAKPPWRAWNSVTVEELSKSELESALRQLPISNVGPTVTDVDRLTRGHPYMVTELIRSVINVDGTGGKIPNDITFVGVDAFLGTVLGDLPRNAQRVASALSVIGRPAPIGLIASVSRAKDAIIGLNSLLEKGLVDQTNGGVALRHDLIRESIYKRLPLFTRNELHRRAGVLLSANPKYVGETAEHYYRARDRRQTYTFALRAAKDADSRYANDESIYFLVMAIKAAKRPHLQHQIRLAERLYRTNRKPQAMQQIQKILRRSAKLSPVDLMKWKLRALELAYDSGSITGPALRAELAEMREIIPKNEIVSLTRNLHLVAHSAFHDGDRAASAATAYTLKTIADRAEPADRVLALATAVHGHATMTSASEADEWAEPLRAQMECIEDPEILVRVLTALTGVAYAAGRLREASTYASRAIEEINRVGAMNLWPMNASHAQMLNVEQGKFSEAEALYFEIKSRCSGVFDIMATASANSAMMHYVKGEYAEAREVSAWGLTQLENRKSTWTELALRSLKGISSLELGDLNQAFASASYAQRQIDSLGSRNVDLSYVEILIAKVAVIKGQRKSAIARLRSAIDDYVDRDLCCRLRMELELARILKPESRDNARVLAKKVSQTARSANAVIIGEGADGLLSRL
jgi:hypothetical protein